MDAFYMSVQFDGKIYQRFRWGIYRYDTRAMNNDPKPRRVNKQVCKRLKQHIIAKHPDGS